MQSTPQRRIPRSRSARGRAVLTVLTGVLAGCSPLVTAQGAPDKPPELPEGAEWKTTASGLRYAVIEQGKGDPVAEVGDRVKAHYTGWLKSDGTKFDSSLDRGRPFEFTVGQGVIRGWSEGLQLMPLGARYRFEIPSALGYGERGSPPVIPANATLVFDIEFVSHKKSRKPHPFGESKPEVQLELQPGIKYEVLRKGEGKSCGAEESFLMHLSLYTDSGELLQSTVVDGQPIPGNPKQMGFPVLQKVPTVMSAGSLLRVECDKANGLGDRSPPGTNGTVWIMEMLYVQQELKLPEFVKPEESELQTSESGLKWKVLKEGKGESPEADSVVVAHYAGWLEDGTSFDSSFSRGVPTPFPLNRVIPGWTEGVATMKPGEQRIFVIPSELGYGERGSPPKIPANSTLVFFIELLSVEG